MLNGGK